jgi:hypothetical protein
MHPENITSFMEGHLSSESDSSLASEENSWFLKAGSSLPIKKNHHLFLS